MTTVPTAKLVSAGVVPFRRTPQGWRLLVLRCYKNWDFPKGRIEEGEEPLDAAKRETRRKQILGFVERHPAPLVMLGAAELVGDRQTHIFLLGFREVVTGGLSCGVGKGLPITFSESKLEIGQTGFLRRFAFRRVKRVLTGFDESFGKIPVPIGAQYEQPPAVRRATNRNQT